MAQRTIYIPAELDARLKEGVRFNVSSICQYAIEQALAIDSAQGREVAQAVVDEIVQGVARRLSNMVQEELHK